MRPMLIERPVCQCPECDGDMFEGEFMFYIDELDESVCEDCADNWFEQYKKKNREELVWG